ncbi:MAG: hypothetical protein K0Q79_955 [Flavipsychrobacter sp.]|nr:hypothetical protein [Flavipsychrobacter sp.]
MNITLKTIAAGALLLATQSTFAQGLDIGLRMNIQGTALLNNSDQAAGPELDAKIHTTAAFGIGGSYMFSSHLGAGIDFLYSKQGHGYKGSVADIPTTSAPDLSKTFQGMASMNSIPFAGTYTARRELTYIKIPIMLKFTGKNTKKVYFSSFIGPQISLLSGAKYKVNEVDINLNSINMTAKDAYKKVSVDLAFGVGAAANLSKNISLSAHFRVDYGLGDAEDKSKTYTTTGPNGGTVKFYPTGRATTNNITAGALISFNYKFTKKEKAPEKGKPGAKPAPRPGTKPGTKPAPKPAPKKK